MRAARSRPRRVSVSWGVVARRWLRHTARVASLRAVTPSVIGALLVSTAVVVPVVWSPHTVELSVQLLYAGGLAVAAMVLVQVTLCSALHLRVRSPHSLRFDRVASAGSWSLHGLLALSLVSGTIWARLRTGSWWAWNTSLTVCGMALIGQVGYVAVRRSEESPSRRADRSAVVALAAGLQVPFIWVAVQMWEPQVAPIDRRAGSPLALDRAADAALLVVACVGLICLTAVAQRSLIVHSVTMRQRAESAFERALESRRRELL